MCVVSFCQGQQHFELELAQVGSAAGEDLELLGFATRRIRSGGYRLAQDELALRLTYILDIKTQCLLYRTGAI